MFEILETGPCLKKYLVKCVSSLLSIFYLPFTRLTFLRKALSVTVNEMYLIKVWSFIKWGDVNVGIYIILFRETSKVFAEFLRMLIQMQFSQHFFNFYKLSCGYHISFYTWSALLRSNKFLPIFKACQFGISKLSFSSSLAFEFVSSVSTFIFLICESFIRLIC